MKIRMLSKGFARWNAHTQQFLDTCPAVVAWAPTGDGKFVMFTYDPTVEVPVAPIGVYFDPDRADDDERAKFAASLLHHEIDRLAESDLRASEEEISALHEILWCEGFGGREDDILTFDDARRVAVERLAWLRLEAMGPEASSDQGHEGGIDDED